MTEPARTPPPIQFPAQPAWCRRCEIHMATTHAPLCPVCLDSETREQR